MEEIIEPILEITIEVLIISEAETIIEILIISEAETIEVEGIALEEEMMIEEIAIQIDLEQDPDINKTIKIKTLLCILYNE